MRVILDLDHTLLRTSGLKKAMQDSLARLGVTVERFESTYRDTVSAIPGQYDYDIDRHAALLHAAASVDQQETRACLFAALDTLPSLLYEDAIPFLHFLRSKNIPAVLFTWGNSAFQKEKIRRLAFEEYFEDIVCTDKAKGEAHVSFTGNEDEWVFINDNPNEIRVMMKRFPSSRMIRIKRPDAKRFSPEDDALDVETYANLKDVEAHL